MLALPYAVECAFGGVESFSCEQVTRSVEPIILGYIRCSDMVGELRVRAGVRSGGVEGSQSRWADRAVQSTCGQGKQWPLRVLCRSSMREEGRCR